MLYGVLAIGLTAFILFIVIIQSNFSNSPQVVQKGTNELHMTNEKEARIVPKKKDLARFKKTESKKSNQKKQENSQMTDKTNAAKKEDTTPVTYSTKYVTVSSLNVRNGPGAQNAAMGAVTINQSVKAEDHETENGWVKISTNDVSGYVNANYLSNDKVIVQADSSNKTPAKSETTQNGKAKKDIKNQNSNTAEDIKPEKKKEKAEIKESKTKEKESKTEDKTAKNDADKLKSIDANNQLILVTSNDYGTSSATIQTFERDSSGNWKRVLNVSGFLGKNGFAGSKVEGDGKSPTGKYSIGTAFGRSGNPGTKLPFRNISADDVWVDDSNSSLYNSWQSRKKKSDQWSSAEDMDISLYTYGFVINYNTAQTKGKGSAIFFHVANGHTLGCTGVSQGNMVSILNWIDPAKNPVIIQTPVSELGNY